MKQTDKGSCFVVWSRDDYIIEANKQLENKTVVKISLLKKQFFRTWLIKAINFLRVFTHTNLLQRKNSKIFPMISKKKQLIKVNYICYLKFIYGFIMYLDHR